MEVENRRRRRVTAAAAAAVGISWRLFLCVNFHIFAQ